MAVVTDMFRYEGSSRRGIPTGNCLLISVLWIKEDPNVPYPTSIGPDQTERSDYWPEDWYTKKWYNAEWFKVVSKCAITKEQ